ncbi:3-dehydroquinate synthase family protein [Rudaeicoccus suwonensis]|uniref:3-dehydroquinate synthase family protein n=1 Tax=Rudaeicoccus suwonensis TaxID=657409 RepID=UPI001477815C|nr:iron-containing alcohol dehydrogenase [Rudaeicoccus suwonensis]
MEEGQDVQALANDIDAALTENGNILELRSSRESSQQIVSTTDLLRPDNALLAEVVADRRALFVVTPTVNALYGAQLKRYIESALEQPGSELLVLDVTEAKKDLNGVDVVVTRATQMGLDRESPIVAIGGGVCLDIVGVSAALFRRGVPNIKVPTTLVGLIDAGVGTKNAVNFGGKKNLLGTFSSPEASLLDSKFLSTLPIRYIRAGAAEMFKMAIISDPHLFHILRAHSDEFQQSRFQAPRTAAAEAIKRSVVEILRELSLNLYERSKQRVLDFGHTFSPYIESESGFRVSHGEAVSIDMAISTEISYALGIVDEGVRRQILDALAGFSLPLSWSGIDAVEMYSSLRSIRQHRNGALHLVAPSALGHPVFLEDEDIDESLIKSCIENLAERKRAYS